MKREWKPGDVAQTASGLSFVSYCRDHLHQHQDEGPHWHHVGGGWDRLSDSEAMQARPLLAIDPESREQIERLREALGADNYYGTAGLLQAALRSLLAPPKPPEPMGMGAVVEDAEGRKWIRLDTAVDPWSRCDPLDVTALVQSFAWPELDVVRVLSDGWVEES